MLGKCENGQYKSNKFQRIHHFTGIFAYIPILFGKSEMVDIQNRIFPELSSMLNFGPIWANLGNYVKWNQIDYLI